MDYGQARALAVSIRGNLKLIASMAARDPGAVSYQQDSSGDTIAFWGGWSGRVATEYNVSEAQRKLADLERQFGADVVSSRSGRKFTLELPVFQPNGGSAS